ncbi:tetratricopeptide repeat protein [Arthrobacter agilis]|uniref:tetratricopeptide repeat protein n=1 Tax=Arthrobacter agilis TaxID=37921 RepID=UPI003609EC8D
MGEYEKSSAIFSKARAVFPGSPELGVFEAITLHAAGQPNESIALLLEVVAESVATPDIELYKPAISGNADYIRSLK